VSQARGRHKTFEVRFAVKSAVGTRITIASQCFAQRRTAS